MLLVKNCMKNCLFGMENGTLSFNLNGSMTSFDLSISYCLPLSLSSLQQPLWIRKEGVHFEN